MRSTTRKLIGQMTNSVDNNQLKVKPRSGKILDTGWASIPNCSYFSLEERTLNPHWLKLGIEVKNKGKKVLVPHVNKKMNDYMKYQITRLRRIQDPEKFWRISWLIIRYSSVFRLAAIHHVMTNWYKKLPYYTILKASRGVDKILKTFSWNIVYRRVYIPKGETHRPLGVPSVEWRILLHMLNNFIHIFVQPHLLPSQHGFVPGRGTLTAWKEIFAKVVDSRFIYECDLKQFFPSIKLSKIDEALASLGMPDRTLNWLSNLNSVQPILPNEKLLDEQRHEIVIEREKWFQKYVRNNPDFYHAFKVICDLNGDNHRQMTDQLDNPSPYSSFAMLKEHWFQNYPGPYSAAVPKHIHPDPRIEVASPWDSKFGVPQGAPTSPLISILTLKSFLSQSTSVSYADDPVFYSDGAFEIKDEPSEGIVIHEGKSGWVKEEGKWNRDLKYLGLRYDPLKDSLFGNTRKGSRLELSAEFRDSILRTFSPKAEMSWNSLFKLKAAGMIFSRLYIGTWKADSISQDFYLLPSDNSWVHREFQCTVNPWKRSSYNTFNVSSFACQSLCKKLTRIRRKKVSTLNEVRVSNTAISKKIRLVSSPITKVRFRLKDTYNLRSKS